MRASLSSVLKSALITLIFLMAWLMAMVALIATVISVSMDLRPMMILFEKRRN